MSLGVSSKKRWARIVIVAYRSGPDLQTCIDALARQTSDAFEAVIVNNDCPEGCTRKLNLPDDRFSIIDAPENLGFAGGSNFGAAQAQTPWIITLNPDAWPEPDWLGELILAAEAWPRATMISSTLIQAERTGYLDGFGDVYSVYGVAWRGGFGHSVADVVDGACEVLAPCGAAAAYRRDAFEAVGGFDSGFFCYLEDVDLGLRLQAEGGLCVQVPGARAHHVGSGSVGKGSDFQHRQTHRNRLAVILKNTPWLVLLPHLAVFAAAEFYLQWRNRDQPGARARWRGTCEAVGRIPHALRARARSRKAFRISLWRFLTRLSWSPRALSRQRPVSWPLRVEEGANETVAK